MYYENFKEAAYTKDELKPDGVSGYRLAPPCKFLDDYTFFRLASDPTLTQEQLIEEMAGFLCGKDTNKGIVAKAINMLEEFWTTHDLKTIEKTEELFNIASKDEKSESLCNISNGVTFLCYIVKIAQPEVTENDNNCLKKELYDTLKTMYIFQGITSDIIWQPESYALFNHKVDMMEKQYMWYKYCILDVVDRNIYPEATSDFVTLNWEAGKKSDESEEEIGRMPGPLATDSKWLK